jgi:two-component system, NarL family, sensor kinase
MNKDSNEIYFFIVIGIVVSVILVSFIIYFVARYQENQRKNALEKMKMKMEYEKIMLQAEIEIKEQTLQNISQEIHDNIGQSLSLVKLNLNTLDFSKPELAHTKADSAKLLVSKAIHDLRDLSKSLNTDTILASGLENAIRYELQMLEKSETFNTSVEMSGTPVRFDPRKELVVFRIFQESLNNIIKHAQATSIMVKMEFHASEIRLSVTDDGMGFQKKTELLEGSGLKNMKKRAALIGGRFDLQTGVSGTTILITLPSFDK